MFSAVHTRRIKILLPVLLVLASPAVAQTYPDYESLSVNDYAEMLTEADEVDLTEQLDALRSDTGVEMTVLTLDSQAEFAADQSLESFATGLFDRWGIGDADRNDGVLVLVLRQERAMRIELGAGYGRNWDGVARDVVDNDFLPHFRKDQFSTGLMTGSAAVIEKIVTPYLNGQAPSDDEEGPPAIFLLLFLVFFLLKSAGVSLFELCRKVIARFRTCPECGHRGLEVTTRIETKPTRSFPGMGIRRLACPKCDYAIETTYTISALSSGISGSGSGGFGGGRSGGGGASGRF